MKLAIRTYIVTLILLTLVFAVSAQRRSANDDRNYAPTVGTGGPVGGPTGLFTVYDATTLLRGEYTFSIAYSNYDRDPGNVDITSVPLSFQAGVTNHLEVFVGTEGWRGVHVNAPRNLSGFYLPNSQVFIPGRGFVSAPAIVLAPQGPVPGPLSGRAVFRPTGTAPFVQFPFTNGNAGTFGLPFPFFSGPQFGFPAGTNALLGPPIRGTGVAANFPGVGSVFGSILPGVVLSTTLLPNGLDASPNTFTLAPSYLPDAPFINRTWGTSSFNSIDIGLKWRMNSNHSAFGYGLIASYRRYLDNANSFAGFNMMQRGSGPGANRGDVNLTFFADARLATWANLEGNIGYTYTTNPKGDFGGTQFTLLDRPDELLSSIAVDFPINKHVQPILELRALRYVGGHTPNAFQRNPLDGIAGVRFYPRRWWGIGAAYRINLNQQDSGSFGDNRVPLGFETSTNPHGFIGQFWIGHRLPRQGPVVNLPANVDSVDLSSTVITLPCPPGQTSRSGACPDTPRTISVTTHASDPENDVLTYNYTVSGGRIIGTGATVQWDVTTATPGTYTITTGVDDGCGVCGRTNTQTITVRECPDCGVQCACPTLSVSGPSGVVNPGTPMTFTANVSGGEALTYNWTVSAGTISSGQGTPSITVDTTGLPANSNVTATVTLGGTLPALDCHCVVTASETASIAPLPTPTTFSEFGPKTPDEIKAELDPFFIQLNNEPNATGYIINYGTPAQIRKRRSDIERAISFRKFPKDRIVFIDGPDTGDGPRTKLIIVPAGVAPPAP